MSEKYRELKLGETLQRGDVVKTYRRYSAVEDICFGEPVRMEGAFFRPMQSDHPFPIPDAEGIKLLRDEIQVLQSEIGKESKSEEKIVVGHLISKLVKDWYEMHVPIGSILSEKVQDTLAAYITQFVDGQIATLRKENEELKERVTAKFALNLIAERDSLRAQLAAAQSLAEKNHADALQYLTEWTSAERDVNILKAQLTAAITERGEAWKALEEIQQVASGERQVANDDTDGLAWIDKQATRVLSSGGNTQHKPGCSVFPKNLCDSFPAGPCDCGVSGEKTSTAEGTLKALKTILDNSPDDYPGAKKEGGV